MFLIKRKPVKCMDHVLLLRSEIQLLHVKPNLDGSTLENNGKFNAICKCNVLDYMRALI